MTQPDLPVHFAARSDDIDPAALMHQGGDRLLHAFAARTTTGVSAVGVALAFSDGWLHLVTSPGKQMELGRKVQRKSVRYADYLTHLARSGDGPRCIEPLEQGSRISVPAWQAWPYNATTGVRGVSLRHEAVVNSTVRQMLDLRAPSNFVWTNPEALQALREQGGANLARGARLQTARRGRLHPSGPRAMGALQTSHPVL